MMAMEKISLRGVIDATEWNSRWIIAKATFLSTKYAGPERARVQRAKVALDDRSRYYR
jgi:hypothetical protein